MSRQAKEIPLNSGDYDGIDEGYVLPCEIDQNDWLDFDLDDGSLIIRLYSRNGELIGGVTNTSRAQIHGLIDYLANVVFPNVSDRFAE